MNSQEKYDKQNAVKITLKLNKKTDKDILELIDDIMFECNLSRQGAIKEIFRRYMYN